MQTYAIWYVALKRMRIGLPQEADTSPAQENTLCEVIMTPDAVEFRFAFASNGFAYYDSTDGRIVPRATVEDVPGDLRMHVKVSVRPPHRRKLSSTTEGVSEEEMGSSSDEKDERDTNPDVEEATSPEGGLGFSMLTKFAKAKQTASELAGKAAGLAQKSDNVRPIQH